MNTKRAEGNGAQTVSDCAESVSSGNVFFVGYSGKGFADLERIAKECGLEPSFFPNVSRFEMWNRDSGTVKAVITDSRYLGFNSRHDWKRFREVLGPYPIWVHISDDVRPTHVAEMMRNGLDEFVPAGGSFLWLDKFFKKIDQIYSLKHGEISRAEHEASLLRKRVEWSNYKESLRKAWNDVSGREAIMNLQTSLSQGAGFGLMLTLMEILGMGGVAGEQVTIDPLLFEKIKSNAQYTRRMLQGLAEYVGIFDRSVVFDRIPVDQIERLMKQRTQQFHELYAKKKMRLMMSETCSWRPVEANMDLIMLVFDELVVNAWKYSRRETDVTILTSIRNGYYTITIQSFPAGMRDFDMKATSLEKLKLPFYRVHPPVEDAVEMERFVMGLGLPAVEQIASKMRGVFILESGTDYCGASAEQCFLAYFMVPLS